MKQNIIRLLFLVAFIFEGWLCYTWLIQPLVPLISDIIAHRGVPTIQMDVAHPLGFSVAGMNGQGLFSLLFDSAIRIAVFSFLFGITAKAFRVAKNITRD